MSNEPVLRDKIFGVVHANSRELGLALPAERSEMALLTLTMQVIVAKAGTGRRHNVSIRIIAPMKARHFNILDFYIVLVSGTAINSTFVIESKS